MLDGAWRAVLAAVGVTRVARVTGLDRAGVEVACAVRPGGHVLQVSNGKGATFEQAAWSAVAEAAELHCAETPDPARFHWGSSRELQGVWPPELLGGAPAGDLRLSWIEAEDLSGGRVLVPATAVHCPRQGTPLGPAAVRWTSNGFGAHPRRERAVAHALLEAIERDQLARALPSAMTERALRTRLLDRGGLEHAAPRTAELVDRIEAAGFDVHLLDLSARGAGAVRLPVAGALLVDREGGPVPLVAGYACRLRRDDALAAALLEACQSRLTDVHGARDDVAPMDHGKAEGLRAALGRVRATRGAGALPDVHAPGGEVRAIVDALRAAGFARAAIADVSSAGLPLHVVKAVVPGLRLSELL